MIQRAIFLFVQRYLWKKLLRGSIRSKLYTLLSIVIATVLAGATFASMSLNMTFIQGAWWTWAHIENSLGSLARLF